MANTRELQSRMKSIKDTMKITSAMHMIASSNLQKAKKNISKIVLKIYETKRRWRKWQGYR